VLAPVPDDPTLQQIAAARSLLLDDLLGEFPFVSEAERAHALALLLLPFIRPMISGTGLTPGQYRRMFRAFVLASQPADAAIAAPGGSDGQRHSQAKAAELGAAADIRH
jgi:hypothetical protein